MDRLLSRPLFVLCATLAGGFLLGVGAMYLLAYSYTDTFLQIDTALREKGKYALIEPLLLCGATQPKDFGEFKPLHDKLEKIIESAQEDGKAESVSIYFRGFGGKWVGINENTPYAPASLLKVPIMIAYFKAAESNPKILQETLTYDGSYDLNAQETFKTQFDIKPGVYKIDDLIKAMIVNSDNNATNLLYEHIDKKSLAEVYTDLGLTVPDDAAPTADIISAKGYSYFFRILYNATYLSPEYSEKAMELLDAPDFPQGLRGGVPETINIAQKFGERTVTTPEGAVTERDLHDCGLIYYPDQPYLLCVMTRGSDYKNLSGVIQSISKTVYEDVKTSHDN